jgi:hypothetical protein
MQTERWLELCKLASGEQDSKKLEALITEINEALDVRQECLATMYLADRLTKQRSRFLA